MSLSLDNAVVYDEECFPNVITLCASSLHRDDMHTFVISPWRNDLAQLIEWVDYLKHTGIPMIGFNNIGYDYTILHFIRTTPGVTIEQIYNKNNQIINHKGGPFDLIIPTRDRLVPQIDLQRIHHFDNQAKRTSLKMLMVNMRSQNVMESRAEFGTFLTEQQLYEDVIPYGENDVRNTKRFAIDSMDAMKLRASLVDQFGLDIMNWNDTKMGEEMLIARLGDDVCYDRSSGRKTKRQTYRTTIPVRDIIFPYIRFETPVFQRVLDFMNGVTLTQNDMKKSDDKDHKSPLTYSAEIGGLTFKFGSGGVHASVSRKRFYAGNGYIIRDIDVAGMYPAISNVNKLAPEHLGSAFVQVYAMLPEERAQYAKGTMDNLRLKLAGNAAWGKSKSEYSCFYDPKYALTIPINGQLMICMLVEQLLKVPTLQLIQANTDGVTYYVHEQYLDYCKHIEHWWQQYTLLVLEDVHYERMFVRDVNNYIAETTKGKRKLKGAYWWPDSFKQALIEQAAHKDYNPTVVQRAAVAAMFDGIDPKTFLRTHVDPFDFMCRVRVDKTAYLMIGDQKVQSVTRYYVSTDGEPMRKIAQPPTGYEIGMWKKASKVTHAEYARVMAETGGEWDERVCTKNRSKYEMTTSYIQAGWKVTDANHVNNFSWSNVNYEWYENEVGKLII